MGQQFRIASKEFEDIESAKIVRNEAAQRKYRLTEYASGSIDEGFWVRLRELFFNPALWARLPPSQQTVEGRALAFRMMSRAGCSFEQLLAAEHRKAPWQTMLLVFWRSSSRGPRAATP